MISGELPLVIRCFGATSFGGNLRLLFTEFCWTVISKCTLSVSVLPVLDRGRVLEDDGVCDSPNPGSSLMERDSDSRRVKAVSFRAFGGGFAYAPKILLFPNLWGSDSWVLKNSNSAILACEEMAVDIAFGAAGNGLLLLDSEKPELPELIRNIELLEGVCSPFAKFGTVEMAASQPGDATSLIIAKAVDVSVPPS